jgi:hypothetical protein
MLRVCSHAECQSCFPVLGRRYQSLKTNRSASHAASFYENEILASRFWDKPACGEDGFYPAVTPTRSLRHNFPMKKILILTSIVLASVTPGMFAEESAPMPSVNIPASPAPATPAAHAQTPATAHAKGKHKGRKHRKRTKKTETKKTDGAAGANAGATAGTK